VPPSSGPDPALARALRSLREDRGLTQERLAHDAGLSVAGYRKIESGRVNPTWTTIARISRALGVSHAEFGRTVDAHVD
jgi:transcriptional regulator with XRE-family HTH domain